MDMQYTPIWHAHTLAGQGVLYAELPDTSNMPLCESTQVEQVLLVCGCHAVAVFFLPLCDLGFGVLKQLVLQRGEG